MSMKTITICGSMKFYNQMTALKGKLVTQGFEINLPTREEVEFHTMDIVQKTKAKRQYIEDHMERISTSDYVIIANYKKNGIQGYVGPNTLIEIAFAKAFKKPIYIIEEPSIQPCLDELRGFDLQPISDLYTS